MTHSFGGSRYSSAGYHGEYGPSEWAIWRGRMKGTVSGGRSRPEDPVVRVSHSDQVKRVKPATQRTM